MSSEWWVNGFFAVLLSLLYILVPLEITPVAIEWEQNLTPIVPNDELTGIYQLAKGKIHEPETVVFDAQGNMFAFVAQGKIVQVLSDESVVEWAFTGGRPISGTFDANGDMILADALIGLLKINKDTREITLLTARSDDGEQIMFPDDVDIGPDGKVYFTDAANFPGKKDSKGHTNMVLTSLYNLFEGTKTGRLLAYDPVAKTTTVLLKGLHFANGLVISHDNTYILINETFGKKIHRYWISGPNKGKHEVFVDTLPGFVDGISQASNGNYWVALPGLEQEAALRMIAGYPSLKGFVSKFFLPLVLKTTKKIGIVYEVDPQGQVVRELYDPDGKTIHAVASVTEHQGKLYLGNFGDFIGVKDLNNN